MPEITVNPKFAIGQVVAYSDRHQREQRGIVQSIEARWDAEFPEPLVIYRVSLSSDRNRVFYVVETDLSPAAARTVGRPRNRVTTEEASDA